MRKRSLFEKAAARWQEVETERVEEPRAGITVRAELRLRNADLIDARKRQGFSQPELGKAAQVPMSIVGALERFDFSNSRAGDHAVRLADFLAIPLESILPPELRGRKLTSTIVATKRVNPAQLLDVHHHFEKRFLLPSPADTVMDKFNLADEMAEAMGGLTSREQEVLKLRYGILDGHEYTLLEIGRRLKVTKERVRQLEAKALRKLQHPVRSRKLSGFMDDDEPPRRSHKDAETVRLSRQRPGWRQRVRKILEAIAEADRQEWKKVGRRSNKEV